MNVRGSTRHSGRRRDVAAGTTGLPAAADLHCRQLRRVSRQARLDG